MLEDWLRIEWCKWFKVLSGGGEEGSGKLRGRRTRIGKERRHDDRGTAEGMRHKWPIARRSAYSCLFCVCENESENESVSRGASPSAAATVAPSLLSAFLHPMKPDDFLNNHWKQRALHLQWMNDDERRKRDKKGAATGDVTAASSSSSSSRGRGRGSRSVSDEQGSSVAEPDRMAYVKETYLCGLKLDGLLEETASDNIFVWVRDKPASNEQDSAAAADSSPKLASPSALHSIELDASNPAHLVAARTLHFSGCSLYFRSPPPMVDEYVTAMSKDVGLSFAGVDPVDNKGQANVKGEIEIFCSRAGHVTDWHTDFQENFTLQLKGRKTWLLKRGSVRHPLRGATPHYSAGDVEEQQLKLSSLADPDFGWHSRPRTRASHTDAPTCEEEEYETVVLNEGDCLYFPAGLWHRVECEEDSVSANISLVALDWSTMVTDGIRQKLWCTDEWRSGISIRNMTEARNYLTQRLDHLRQVVESFDASDFLPPCLFLPRRTHFVIQNTPIDDESCHRLCALATLEETKQAEDGMQQEKQLAPTKTKGKGKRAKAHSDALAASSASSPPSTANASAADFTPLPSIPLHISSITQHSIFRVNPLCILVRFEHEHVKGDIDDGESDDAEDAQSESDDEYSDEHMDNDDDDDDDDGDATSENGRHTSSSPSVAIDTDAEFDDGEEKVGYVLHFNVGGSDMESYVRITINLSASLQSKMELIRDVMMKRKWPSFTFEQMIDLLPKPEKGHQQPNSTSTSAAAVGSKRARQFASSSQRSSTSNPPSTRQNGGNSGDDASGGRKRRKIARSHARDDVDEESEEHHVEANGDEGENHSLDAESALRKLLFFLVQQGALQMQMK